ncbi:DUF2922 domain-containing protein [Desulfitobacterium sp.]|nr:DUF2922 domain-containing protein [Desulfitobacterium sp.]MEA4901541.1 DUF2922 domain-containing protein [Desulfitobacterium sp.]
MTIPDPKKSLQKAETKAVMDTIIQKDIFLTKELLIISEL